MTKCKYYKVKINKNYDTSTIIEDKPDYQTKVISNLLGMQEEAYCELYKKNCICKGKGFNCDFDKSRRNSFNAIKRR